jgi:hypothetical protein
VLTFEGRASRIGTQLPCRQCDDAEGVVIADSLRSVERVRNALVRTQKKSVNSER